MRDAFLQMFNIMAGKLLQNSQKSSVVLSALFLSKASHPPNKPFYIDLIPMVAGSHKVAVAFKVPESEHFHQFGH